MLAVSETLAKMTISFLPLRALDSGMSRVPSEIVDAPFVTRES
jgi:hypothetical protein